MNRTDLLNHLAEKHNLQRYLEIGVQVPELNFDRVKCIDKVGVDPDPVTRATFCMTSDDFFAAGEKYSGKNAGPMDAPEAEILSRGPFVMNEDYIKRTVSFGIKFDLIFIDGLHTSEQVEKDFFNSLALLNEGGFVVIHDCSPLKEEHTIVPRPTPTGHWNGDVYKFACRLVNKQTVDIDNGCLVFQKAIPVITEPVRSWSDFNDHRKELLNLISWDEFVSTGSHV